MCFCYYLWESFMIKKSLTKEQRYALKMQSDGYQRKHIWIHKSILPKVLEFIAREEKKRNSVK